MAKFKYRAMNPSGERINAEYEADSKNEVISMLTSNGYYPLKIEKINQSKEININVLKKVTLKDISVFCRQMYTMIDAGITINRALSILSNQTTNKILRKSIKEIEEEVVKGEVLSIAMKKHSDIFPELLINMIEVGEVTGNLDDIMLKMADQYEKENKINNKVKVAMIYPTVLGFICIGVVVIMMTFVMPRFVTMLEDMGGDLPLTTTMLINISNFMIDNIIILSCITIVIILMARIYSRTEHGVRTLSVMKLSFPIINKLNQKIIVSRFTRTLSILLSSGIPMIKALELISDLVGNKLAEEEILSMKQNITRGEQLYNSMERSDIFPEMLATMVKIGEESGSLDEILYKTADFYDEELENQIQITAATVEPLLIVVMGGIVAFIVISIVLPMTGMYDAI